jgi:hypothetical protein
MRLLCGLVELSELPHGAIQTMVVTAPEYKINSGLFIRFVPWASLLLPFWQMEAL